MAGQSLIKNTIVLVPFPFDDFSFSKVRPALCLTSEIGKFNHVIVAFISSQIPDDLTESDLIIRKTSKNSINTGLKVDSVIRLHKMVTIPKSLIIRKLGEINPSVQREVRRNIKQLFSIQ
jgi:mRNA interferase MazF